MKILINVLLITFALFLFGCPDKTELEAKLTEADFIGTWQVEYFIFKDGQWVLDKGTTDFRQEIYEIKSDNVFISSIMERTPSNPALLNTRRVNLPSGWRSYLDTNNFLVFVSSASCLKCTGNRFNWGWYWWATGNKDRIQLEFIKHESSDSYQDKNLGRMNLVRIK